MPANNFRTQLCEDVQNGPSRAGQGLQPPMGFPGARSSTELWMWPQGPSTLHWQPDSRARFPAIPIDGSDHCQLLPVTCFLEILIRSEMAKQQLGEASFCTSSWCFDLQSVLPAVERKHHPVSPLCMSPVITLGPDCWSKLR